MTDLFALFSKLVTPQGKILVPGINEKVRSIGFDGLHLLPSRSHALARQVAPLTDQERKLYEDIDVTLGDFEQAIGAKVTISEDKAEVLMGRMRYPSESTPRTI